jgi:hypothetical protein
MLSQPFTLINAIDASLLAKFAEERRTEISMIINSKTEEIESRLRAQIEDMLRYKRSKSQINHEEQQ